MKVIIDTTEQKNIKKFNSYITEKITAHKDDIQYLTMDNGGLPFIINHEPKYDRVTIFKDILTFNDVKKVFTGDDKEGDKNATFLINTKDNEYVQVGNIGIFQFETADNDKIEEYVSPIGNSAVPYPYAIGKKYIYFMLDDVYVDKKEFEDIAKKHKKIDKNANTYSTFYNYADMKQKNGKNPYNKKISQEDYIKTYKMKKFKKLAKRGI